MKQGDRVAYAGPIGGYAEERLIDADRAVKLPDGYLDRAGCRHDASGHDRADAASLGFPVQKGDMILVHAAAGGVGLIMCQWAAALGATVIGTVGTRREGRARASARLRASDPLHEAGFRGRGAPDHRRRKLPVVYDCVGRDTFLKSLDCLKLRGLMVSFGNASGPPDPIPPNLLAQKGSLYLTRPTLFHYSRPASSSSRVRANYSTWSKAGK